MRAMKCMFVGIYLLVIAAFLPDGGDNVQSERRRLRLPDLCGPVAGLLYHRPLQQTVKAERVRTSGPKENCVKKTPFF